MESRFKRLFHRRSSRNAPDIPTNDDVPSSSSRRQQNRHSMIDNSSRYSVQNPSSSYSSPHHNNLYDTDQDGGRNPRSHTRRSWSGFLTRSLSRGNRRRSQADVMDGDRHQPYAQDYPSTHMAQDADVARVSEDLANLRTVDLNHDDNAAARGYRHTRADSRDAYGHSLGDRSATDAGGSYTHAFDSPATDGRLPPANGRLRKKNLSAATTEEPHPHRGHAKSSSSSSQPPFEIPNRKQSITRKEVGSSAANVGPYSHRPASGQFDAAEFDTPRNTRYPEASRLPKPLPDPHSGLTNHPQQLSITNPDRDGVGIGNDRVHPDTSQTGQGFPQPPPKNHQQTTARKLKPQSPTKRHSTTTTTTTTTTTSPRNSRSFPQPQQPSATEVVRRAKAGPTADTTIHERIAPAVTHEKIIHHTKELKQEVITRDIHTHDIFHRVLPIIDVEVLPTRHFLPVSGGGLVEVDEKDLPGRAGFGREGVGRNWVIAETASRGVTTGHDEAGMGGGGGHEKDEAITGTGNGSSQRGAAGVRGLQKRREFTAREFPGQEGDYRSGTFDDGEEWSYTTWVHPPEMEEGGKISGQTWPMVWDEKGEATLMTSHEKGGAADSSVGRRGEMTEEEVRAKEERRRKRREEKERVRLLGLQNQQQQQGGLDGTSTTNNAAEDDELRRRERRERRKSRETQLLPQSHPQSQSQPYDQSQPQSQSQYQGQAMTAGQSNASPRNALPSSSSTFSPSPTAGPSTAYRGYDSDPQKQQQRPQSQSQSQNLNQNQSQNQNGTIIAKDGRRYALNADAAFASAAAGGPSGSGSGSGAGLRSGPSAQPQQQRRREVGMAPIGMAA
ncbi:hypothetical protein MMC25_006623 [Agyrium rufum]|nr:hypothetical protein [Agyrium rufum]